MEGGKMLTGEVKRIGGTPLIGSDEDIISKLLN
jgi:hypothetical protein